jgi:hypothetical protein
MAASLKQIVSGWPPVTFQSSVRLQPVTFKFYLSSCHIVPAWLPVACKLYPRGCQLHANCTRIAASCMQIVPAWLPVACKLYPRSCQSHANCTRVAASRRHSHQFYTCCMQPATGCQPIQCKNASFLKLAARTIV